MTYFKPKPPKKKTCDNPVDWLSSCYLQRPEPNWLKHAKKGNELWILQNWSSMIQHQPSITTLNMDVWKFKLNQLSQIYRTSSFRPPFFWCPIHSPKKASKMIRFWNHPSTLHPGASGIAAPTGIQTSGLRSTSSSNEKAPKFQRHEGRSFRKGSLLYICNPNPTSVTRLKPHFPRAIQKLS